MALPPAGTSPLDNPDHTAEHVRLNTRLDDMARGIIAYHDTGGTAGLSITTAATVIYTLSSVPLLKGRQYLFSFSVRAISYGGTAGTATNVYFSLVPNMPIRATTLILDAYRVNLAGAAYDNMYWEQPFIAFQDITVPTISVQAQASSTVALWTELGSFIMIRDIGRYRDP